VAGDGGVAFTFCDEASQPQTLRLDRVLAEQCSALRGGCLDYLDYLDYSFVFSWGQVATGASPSPSATRRRSHSWLWLDVHQVNSAG